MKHINNLREHVTGTIVESNLRLGRMTILADDGRQLEGRMPQAVRDVYVRNGKRIQLSLTVPFFVAGINAWRFENARGVKVS